MEARLVVRDAPAARQCLERSVARLRLEGGGTVAVEWGANYSTASKKAGGFNQNDL